MAVIYAVRDEFADSTEYFAKKDEACAHARFIFEFTGWITDVVQHETAKISERDLVIALLKNKDWSGKQEIVYTARPRIRKGKAASDDGESGDDDNHVPDTEDLAA